MGRELDVACARALRWTRGKHARADGSTYTCDYWHDAQGNHTERAEDDRCMECHQEMAAWSPSTDPATTPQLLAEIARRGLQDAYIRAFYPAYHSFEAISVPELFALLRATPEQHARAFLEVIGHGR